eukprot:GHVS01105836.1.p1 GENE.GHVS01105836.1~~GHVS01105836.1.p1  ORF type:complete len:342 (-),score=56.75 GHVS01105836.1:255-1280(-)
MAESGEASSQTSPPLAVGDSGGVNLSVEEGNVEWAQHIQEDSQMSSAVVPSSSHSTFAQSNKCCLSTPNASVDSFLFGRSPNYTRPPNKQHFHNNSTTSTAATTTSTTTSDCGEHTVPTPTPEQLRASFAAAHPPCCDARLLQHEPWTVDDAACAFNSMHLSPSSSQVASSPYHAAASVEQWRGAELPTPSENPLGWQNLDRLACLLLSRVKNANLRQRKSSLVFIFLILNRVVARGNSSARRHALYRWKTCLGLSASAHVMLGVVPDSTKAHMLRLDEVLRYGPRNENDKKNSAVPNRYEGLANATTGNITGDNGSGSESCYGKTNDNNNNIGSGDGSVM